MKKIFLFTSIFLITLSFDIFAQGPPPTNLLATNITATSAELSWFDNGCAGLVTVKYKVAGSAAWLSASTTASSPYSLTGLTAATDYEWRVKCTGATGGGTWSTTELFSTASLSIDTAFISQPITCNGQYTNDEMQIEINQTTPVTTYQCIVGQYPFAGYFSSQVTTNQTQATIFNLNNFDPNIDWYVRIVDSAAYYSGNGGFPSGSSTVGIYDEFGPITFSEPAQLAASTSIVSSNQCTGDCIAAEDLTITGGTMPYSFDITSSGGTSTQNLASGVSSYSFINLCADNYDIVVTDANGCSTSPSTTPFNIAPIAPIAPAGQVSIMNLNNYNVSCYGAADGSITASATGGTGVFTYSLDGIAYQASNVFTGLIAGTYDVYYKDANGCVATEQLTLNEPPNLSGSASVTQLVDCYGANTGEVTFLVDPFPNSGVGPYDYSLDGLTWQSNSVFGNLFGDSIYNVGVQDNNGCQYFVTVPLGQPVQISFSDSMSNYNGFQVSCDGANDGTIDFIITSGGLAPYEYSIDGGGAFSSLTSFLNLFEGDYYIEVKDGNGCIERDTLSLFDPGPFSLSPVISPVSCPQQCDGEISSINPSGSVGTNILFDIDGGTQQTAEQFTALCGGLTNGGPYIINAIDENGCTAAFNALLPENPAFIYTTSNQDDFCSQSTGQAEIDISQGGTGLGTYLYAWNTVPVQTSATATGLFSGTYSVTVTDAAGCQFSESVTVAAFQGFTVSYTTLSPCLGINSGSATVSATGTAPYLYQWYDVNGNPIGINSSTLSGVPVGTYYVDVTDNTTCVVRDTVQIPPLVNPIILDSVVVKNNSCFNLDDAQIEIFVSGGFTPYTYSSNGSSPQSNSDFGSLSPGNYNIQAFDNNGCYVDTLITLVYPGLLEIDSVVFTDVSCNGANDGAIQSIIFTGGTAPFEYSINNGIHQTYMGFSGLDPGWHIVQIFDANNCAASNNIYVEEPDVLEVEITTSGWDYNSNSGLYTYQIRCNGDSSGFADISMAGGISPYTGNYIFNGNSTNFNPYQTISALSAGIYTFEITDNNGCVFQEMVQFNEPDSIIHTFIPTHVSCIDSSWGSLTDSVYGGVGDATSYIYAWSTGDSTYTLNNIPADIYFITVIDENDCLSLDSFIINDDNALAATSAIVQNVSCFDACDGEIKVEVTGLGVPFYDVNNDPYYEYQWDDFLSQTNDTVIGLCVDNTTNSTVYTCVITDAEDCPITISVTLVQPDSLSVSAEITSDWYFQDISCYGASDGKAIVDANGGNPAYSYLWSDGQSTSSAVNLSAGNYVVVVTDANGCMDSTDITLVEPPQLDLSVETSNVSCFGYDDAEITVDADGGTPFLGIPPKYLYFFSGPTNFDSDTVPISTATDLAPGIYTITVKDANGCTVTAENIFITEPLDALGIIDLDSINESCNLANGEIRSEIEGGVQPYSYLWSNGDTLSDASGLVSGVYTLIVTDYNGCQVVDSIRVFGSMEVFLPGYLESFVDSICLGETVDLNIKEQPGFSYLWINENDTLLNKTIDTINSINESVDITVSPQYSVNIYTLTISDPECAPSYDVIATIYVDSISPMIASEPGVETGEHPIVLLGDNIELYSVPEGGTSPYSYTWQWSNGSATNVSGEISDSPENSEWYHVMVEDAQGCLGFDSIYVLVGVLPYEAITPNGDGMNDTWMLEGMELYPDALIQIFNRWGGLVYESVGGTQYQPWDGTDQGKELSVGTYYYIIELNTGDDAQTGTITIIR
tara:strand:+ start:19737 stop:24971 length:5235 start_codon:yes stop_codon:yes gene_type:complete